MKEIIKLIVKYHVTIIFILLEIISFSLIVHHNNYQRTIFSSHTSSLFCTISSGISAVENYFALKNTNERLVAENTELKNAIEKLRREIPETKMDSLITKLPGYHPEYIYQNARIINASYNKNKNYITIDKGSLDGIAKEMAVCSEEGVIGIVQNTSDRYAIVLPLINTNLRLSAKLKKNGYFGSVQWDGDNYRYSWLNDIPFHVDVAVGDTIVTSGLSTIFPEGELIGYVESVGRNTANFLSVKVKLATDFHKITGAYVIKNLNREEQLKLEETTNE